MVVMVVKGRTNVVAMSLFRRTLPRVVVSLGLCLGLVSCTGPQSTSRHAVSQPAPADVEQKLASATALQTAIATSSLTDYRIHPLDTIQINVFNEANLSVKAHVSTQGTINYPLLGPVRVGGLTITEAENLLKEGLARDYLVNPQVSVLVDQTNRRVFLLGQVRSPGAIEFPPDAVLTLLQAIARAGGFTAVAASDHVSIIRSEGGAEKKIIVNVAAIIKSGDKSKDVELQPDDVVSVPESVF